ncbi:hypothetical protein [Actinomadura sp. 6N118]|uniref:hypothetical protein n=1 Tax=Actinomadura sp. 6N118 TaxID=3375151 RepID=UPI00378C2C23
MLLDGDEAAVGVAYARLIPIVDRLIIAPFDRAAYRAMATYLESEAWKAADAFDRLALRGEDVLAQRVTEIEAAVVIASHNMEI